MANPIVAILSIAGVVGAGGAAMAVNNEVLQQVSSSDPVIVTVEGEPVVIGGGTQALLPTPKTSTPPTITTKQVPVQQQTQTQTQQQAVASQTPSVAVAPAPEAPATHTGASGRHGGEQEDDEYEDREEVETHDDSIEDSEDEREEADD